MFDQVAADAIDEVVKEWMGQNRAFTSYDVTKEVQNRLKLKGTINWGVHRHSELRGYYKDCRPLRDEVEYGDYKEQLVDVGQGLQATLYFPSSYDVTNYKPLPRHNSPATPPTQARPSSPSNSSGTASSSSGSPVRNPPSVLSDDKVKVQDKLSILRIPRSVMQAAGFAPGDEVYVTKDNNTVVLTKQAPGSATTLTVKKVEDRGGLRFYKSVRSKLLGLSGDAFSVKADANHQKVSLAEA